MQIERENLLSYRRELSDEAASVWSRFIAYLLDTLLLVPVLVVVFLVSGFADKSFDEISDLVAENDAGLIALMAGSSSVLFAYRVIMHRYYGQTLGKKALGIGLSVAGDSQLPAWDRLIIRELFVVYAQFIPVAGVYISLGDSISLIFSPGRRSWHDRASGTEVRRFSDV